MRSWSHLRRWQRCGIDLRAGRAPDTGPQGTVKAHTEGILNVSDADRDSVNREAMVGGEEEHERA
jgi:hypothetical protein